MVLLQFAYLIQYYSWWYPAVGLSDFFCIAGNVDIRQIHRFSYCCRMLFDAIELIFLQHYVEPLIRCTVLEFFFHVYAIVWWGWRLKTEVLLWLVCWTCRLCINSLSLCASCFWNLIDVGQILSSITPKGAMKLWRTANIFEYSNLFPQCWADRQHNMRPILEDYIGKLFHHKYWPMLMKCGGFYIDPILRSIFFNIAHDIAPIYFSTRAYMWPILEDYIGKIFRHKYWPMLMKCGGFYIDPILPPIFFNIAIDIAPIFYQYILLLGL